MLVDNVVVNRRWMANDVLTARRTDMIHVRVRSYGRPTAVGYTVNAGGRHPQITGSERWRPGQPRAARLGPGHRPDRLHDRHAALLSAPAPAAAWPPRSPCRRRALAGVANLGWLSEAARRSSDRPHHGNHVYGSFGTDFACSDGHRVMVVARSPPASGPRWSRSCRNRRRLQRPGEGPRRRPHRRDRTLYRLRDTIAAVLKPWFLARDSRPSNPS
ncbi:hypothetical protein HBB16_12515 [Pseudonocardia sp. MCCB 268]|nr:hypothetical protein [Pseudonocardia cytotoxica]